MGTRDDRRGPTRGTAGAKAQTQEPLRSTIERSPLSMVGVEGARHLVREANPAFCRLVGMAREGLIGAPLDQVVPGGDGCLECLDRVSRTGEAETFVAQVVSQPAGAFRSYAVWPVLAVGDRPAGLLVQVTDTTEAVRFRRDATAMNEELLVSAVRQSILRETAERLNEQLQDLLKQSEWHGAETDAILEAIPHAVYCGTEDRITRCNAAALRMLGAVSLPDLSQRSGELRAQLRMRYRQDGGLVEPDRLPFARALRGESATLDVWATRCDTGEDVLIRTHATPVQVNGRVFGAVVVHFDITDHYRAQQALQASQDALEAQKVLLEAIVEQAADGIVVRDAAGRVTFVNAVARRWAVAAPEGTPLDQAPDVWGETFDAEGHRLPVAEWPISFALRGETRTGVEFHRSDRKGAPHVILNSAAPLRNARGDLIGAVAINADITPQEEMHAQLRSALADKEMLIREVHHRVKNNLQMLCDVLYLQMDAMADPEKAEVLRDTYGRIYAIARLHEQLYRSMHSGRVLFRDYLAQLLAGFETLYPRTPIRVEIPPESLYMDVDRAIHAGLIVNELVTNALKHAFTRGEAGEVMVRLRAVGDAQVELQVRDTGLGLPADFNLDQAKTLGLRIVHILAKRLDATLSIANQNGATFTLTFPLRGEQLVEPQ